MPANSGWVGSTQSLHTCNLSHWGLLTKAVRSTVDQTSMTYTRVPLPFELSEVLASQTHVHIFLRGAKAGIIDPRPCLTNRLTYTNSRLIQVNSWSPSVTSCWDERWYYDTIVLTKHFKPTQITTNDHRINFNSWCSLSSHPTSTNRRVQLKVHILCVQACVEIARSNEWMSGYTWTS